VGELQPVQLVAGEDGEDAVEAGEFVDEEGEGDEFGGGAEGDDVEEGLHSIVSIHVVCWVSRGCLPEVSESVGWAP
jgi:hypothetical protein